MIRIVAYLGFGACSRRRLDWENVFFFFSLITCMQASGLCYDLIKGPRFYPYFDIELCVMGQVACG